VVTSISKLKVNSMVNLIQGNTTGNNERKKMKKQISVISIIALLFVSGITAQAESVHLIGDLAVTDGGTSAEACGKLAGLGNADVTITLTGTATVETACTNPAGNIAPGNAEKVVTGSITLRATEIKNGTVSFCVKTADPACSSARDCGCPNNNWSATITDVEFESLVLTVVQKGKVVLQETVL
jgi:hypothetical protein